MRQNVSSSKVGVVVSAGKMSKAVKVRIAGQEWNKHIRKYFPSPRTYLVADPNSSLVEGDVVRIQSGWRTSKAIRHVVTAIVAPFGPPVEDRPPVLTEEQRMAERLKHRLAKDVRSKERGRMTSVWRLKEAHKAGHEIPDLESAMANIRLQEAEAAVKARKGRSEAHQGQVGQQLSANEKKRLERQKNRLERQAEEKAKNAKLQTA
ncbi:nucleic acid-binding protein [Lophiostoma macrostomum CBS 122681]|uniref:Nucleic acid-binding protein n=1 Tax=Lophiostoma macrostomum CBS 122681 TaxID=1314788 RepID=A0A6A6SX60_9PLEO|nr:nucleic acid-binding protein [Lophiostoma macrostomum CBS 122681]